MTKKVNHFIGSPRPIKNRAVKVYGGIKKVMGEGKIKWKIEYKDGKIHSIIIHNVKYVPEATTQLQLSQKWDQQDAGKSQNLMAHGTSPRPRSTTLYNGISKGTSVTSHET